MSIGGIAAHAVAGGVHIDYATTVLADAPIVYYRMGETSGGAINDSSGHGNNGSYSNSPLLGQPALITGDANLAMGFTGTSNSANTNLTTAPSTGITLEAWTKIASGGGGYIVGMWGGSNQRNSFLTSNSDGSASWVCKINGTEFGFATAAGLMALNAPHHIVGTFDGTTMLIYIDGAQQGTHTLAGTLGPSNGESWKIAYLGADPTKFVGTIDEVAIYGSALSAARIAAHYASGIS